MNKRYYILTLLSTVCCLLIFTLYPSFSLLESYTHSQHPTRNDKIQLSSSTFLGGIFGKKQAFATMICDPKMMEATLVSIYSLKVAYTKKPSSKSDIIVLLPESIEFNTNDIQQLEKLGTYIIRTSYPVTTSSCDNTIVNLWALFDYQKIVYFSPDIIFDNNVDQLFDYPSGSAFTTNDIHTPLFILEPNPTSFELLVKDYRKSLFKLENSFLIDYNSRLSKEKLANNVLVYTGPMRPWNFHSYSDVDWKKYYDPVSFYKWRRINNDVRNLFNPQTEWKNAARQRTVCDSYLASTNISSDITSFSIQDQFSVMISTYNPERIEHLSLIIRHLLKSKKIHTVFVTWHNPDLQVPKSLYADIKERDLSRVKVLGQTFDSLNNRFNPTEDLKTDAVYIMDDDIYLDLNDLEFTYSVWKSRKDSVVGHFPRLHTYNPESHVATYDLIGKAPYSIVLTKSMFIRSDYLFSYTCLLEPELHASVDSQLNCEDLGFSMMASGLSGAAPTHVRPRKTIEDFGLKKGISTNTAHMPARAECISDFITKYWNEKDPLVKSYYAVSPFVKPRIRAGNWGRVEKNI